MVKGIVTKGAFYWLRSPRNSVDLRTDEWILAIIRLLLGVCYLGAILRPDSTHELKLYEIATIAYLCYGILIIAVLYFRKVPPPLFHVWISLADMLWAAQLICLVHWPAMSFVLMLFVVASAAFRWGFWEVHLAFISFCILLVAGSYAHHPDLLAVWLSKSPLALSAEALLYFGVVCMVGLLAEAKAVRSQSNVVDRVIAGVRLESGLEQALRVTIMEGLQVYGATQFLVVMHEKRRNRALLFRGIHPQTVMPSCELDASQYAPYLFPEAGTSVRLAIAPSSGQKQFRCSTLKAGKIQKANTNCDLTEAFLAAHPFRLLLAVALALEDDWTVRVYMIDPKPFFGGAAGLRFLEHGARQVAPVIHNLFMVDRLMTRATAAASGHVARELHDGILQSLSCINLQMEDLRRQAGAIFAPGMDPLERIQQSIQKEIDALRDFTQQLRSLELDSKNLLSFLASMAVKFQFEHGIVTRFVSEVDEVLLSPRICVELARITQEALVNVRKHSDAKEALIRLSRRDGNFVLSIIDNGRGFGFSGHCSHEELLSSGQGPQVLMERAKAIGGVVSIESIEGSGACLEVVFPPQ